MEEIKYRDIPLDEWNAYDWVEISSFGEEERVFIRARKLVDPPDDGFAYVDCTHRGDAEQRWCRAKTSDSKKKEEGTSGGN